MCCKTHPVSRALQQLLRASCATCRACNGLLLAARARHHAFKRKARLEVENLRTFTILARHLWPALQAREPLLQLSHGSTLSFSGRRQKGPFTTVLWWETLEEGTPGTLSKEDNGVPDSWELTGVKWNSQAHTFLRGTASPYHSCSLFVLLSRASVLQDAGMAATKDT